MAQLLPNGQQQFFYDNGSPLANGKVYFYAVGTTTPKTTYADSAGSVPNTNPVTLDSAGRAVIYGSGTYRQIVKDVNLVQIWDSETTDPSSSGTTASLVKFADGNTVQDLASTDPSKGAALVGLIRGTVADAILYVTPQMFGAKADGVTDDTAALQAAIDFVSASTTTRKIVAFTGNTFRITGSLKIAASNVWLDLGRAGLTLDDSTGLLSHIVVGDGVTQKNQIIIDNIVFGRTQAATAGYAIDTDLLGIFAVRNCRIYGDSKIYNGINLHRTTQAHVLDNLIDNVINFGLYLEGSGTGGNKTIDTTIRGNRISGCASCLVTWDFVEGLYCRDNIFYNTSKDLVSMSASTNANGLVSFKLQQNDFDTSVQGGMFIDNISNVQITDNWFSNTTLTALQSGSGSNFLVVTGNQIYPNAKAIEIGGDSTLIDSNVISGGTTCITIDATATNNVVANNIISNADKAIDLSNNPADADIAGNKIYSMTSGAIYDAATPNSRNIRNNIGDTELGKVHFISVGASPFTYTSSGRPETVSVYGGGVSNISINGQTVAFGTDRSFMVPPNTTIAVTYSSKPTMSHYAV